MGVSSLNQDNPGLGRPDPVQMSAEKLPALWLEISIVTVGGAGKTAADSIP